MEGREATGAADGRRASDARAALLDRLRRRRVEIEGEILARIYSVPGPVEVLDPAYSEGLRAAVPAALDYCLAGIERGEGRPSPIPTALLSQARIAARNEVSLDTVLRRYFAGYTLLGDFLVDEAEAIGLRRGAELKSLLRALSVSFDRLLAAVCEEHGRELKESAHPSSGQRRSELVQRLLAGERLDAAELGYDLEAPHHVGLIAWGPEAGAALRALARDLDRRVLATEAGEETVWAWLGGRRAFDFENLQRHLGAAWPPTVSLAIGEPGGGIGGWRLTHRQAQAALPIARRRSEPWVRYGDVAVLAATIRDELLSSSLRELYLVPLESERDGGVILRETLRAYFAAERNVSSSAATLDVSRQTVAKRLLAVEQRLGRSLGSCGADLEAALRLECFLAAAGPRLNAVPRITP